MKKINNENIQNQLAYFTEMEKELAKKLNGKDHLFLRSIRKKIAKLEAEIAKENDDIN